MTATAQTTLPLPRRLWIYQAERFPLLKHGLLIAVFGAAGATLSAHLGGRTPPDLWTYIVACGVAFLLFFQLRVSDEVKDAEEDRRFRPERAVPRGLVTLRLLVVLGIGAAVLQAAAAGLFHPALLLVLGLVWLWMALMAVEFLVPAWLKQRPVLYLVSHMLVMPLIDLFVTACEWLPRAGTVPPGLWGFLVLSFANGCVIEIGRKTWAPSNERPGVETYSAAWGLKRALVVWIGCLLAAAVLTAFVGYAAKAFAAVVLAAGLAGAVGLGVAFAMLRSPTAEAQKRLEDLSGLWVLASYGVTGFLPLFFAEAAA